MSEVEFAKGVKIEVGEGPYGEWQRISIDTEKIKENPMNGTWVNFYVRKSKNGNYYAALPKPKRKEE